uniref:Protein kinase domain-containing protein n=1 Tax=Kalanchoe fedtschenkoi TaxID=63787 RepID=A0A7N0TAB9_KALFE
MVILSVPSRIGPCVSSLLVMILVLVLVMSIDGVAGKRCERSCGSGKSVIRLNYPFGFSEGCEIRLDCSRSENGMRIGDFHVQSVTASNIFVNVTPKCNRPLEAIELLFGRNFGLTWKNSLLLQDCSSQAGLGGCLIPTGLVESRFKLEKCDARSDNISCYSEDKRGRKVELMNHTALHQVKCTSLFSSVAVNFDTLELNRVELSWWLDGSCKCHQDANCTTVSLLDGTSGYRCSCKEGLHGDGFADGEGCRKVPHCNPARYLSGHCGGTTRVIVLIGGIAAGALLMAGFAIVSYCFCQQSVSEKSQLSTRRLVSEAAGGSGIPFYQYREIEKATSGFDIRQRLGTGAYGTVYAGKLHQDEWVAIKKIKHRDNESIEQVMNEVKLLSSVSHPHLVRLLGCCIENGEQILVYEYMPNGTLSQHLQRERGKGLPWSVRLRIASETAHAISYLHSSMNPPIYHRDIKSSNILLDYNFRSKVADFGLSRLGLTETSHISTAPQGTPGYLDPQYHQNFHLSDKSDVYSFGVVLVEIITGMKVVDFSRPHSEVNLAALATDRIGRGCVDEIIDPFLDPHKDEWTLFTIHKVAELAFRCLAYQSDARPSMMEVAEELEVARTSGWSTMEENVCMESSIASTCSSPFNGSEKCLGGGVTIRKMSMGSCRVMVPKKTADCLGIGTKEVKDSSPVSVQDPWLSDQSSPSTNSLLGNAIR